MRPEIQTLVASDGNVDLAAERMGITPAELIGNILGDDSDDGERFHPRNPYGHRSKRY